MNKRGVKMIIYILCFAPTLLAFLLIKNNNIKEALI
jgi:hypothetical protein